MHTSAPNEEGAAVSTATDATESQSTERTRARNVGFWVVATMYAIFLFASSVPSPLYVVYQARWHFSTITLTAIFAVYVVALLVTLVFAGSLSDHIGRRAALLAAGMIQIAALVSFALAPDVTWLAIARVLQGVATGLATGALSAWLLDLAPAGRPGRAATVGSVAPAIGLALGALSTGLLVQYAPAPTHLVFWLLTVLFVVGAVALARTPETVAARSTWWRALRPRVNVPTSARQEFLAVTPCLIAVWALSGLVLSLGASLTAGVLHIHSHVVAGLVVSALTGTAVVATLATTRVAPRVIMIGGCLALIAGVLAVVISIHVGSTALFFTGCVVAGIGFGPAFTGAFRIVVAVAPPAERAGLIAAIFAVSYLAFSVPAVAAGVAITHVGLVRAATWYGIGLIALAAAAIPATINRQPQRPSMRSNCPACPGTTAVSAAMAE
jgi:MFS family permease